MEKAEKVGDRSFGLRLKELREEKNLSQEELAEKLHLMDGMKMTQSMISKYEEFVNTPRQKNENRFIQFFGLTKSQFYAGKGIDQLHSDLTIKHKIEAFIKLYESEDNAINRYLQDRSLIYQEIKTIIDGK